MVQRWLGPSGKVLFGDKEERSGDEFVVRGDEKPLVGLRESWIHSSSLWLLTGADCSLWLGFLFREQLYLKAQESRACTPVFGRYFGAGARGCSVNGFSQCCFHPCVSSCAVEEGREAV